MTSTEYYQKNPTARRKKARTDKRINARKDQIQKRVEANRERRRAKRNGRNVVGKDYDHATNSFVSVKKNRGRKGEGNR